MKLLLSLEALLFFLKELVVANFQVTLCILKPNRKLRPAIIRLPLDLISPKGITILANLITLTPGTLTLEVSPDRQALFVHVIDCVSSKDVCASIKNGFERRLIRIFDK